MPLQCNDKGTLPFNSNKDPHQRKGESWDLSLNPILSPSVLPFCPLISPENIHNAKVFIFRLIQKLHLAFIGNIPWSHRAAEQVLVLIVACSYSFQSNCRGETISRKLKACFNSKELPDYLLDKKENLTFLRQRNAGTFQKGSLAINRYPQPKGISLVLPPIEVWSVFINQSRCGTCWTSFKKHSLDFPPVL